MGGLAILVLIGLYIAGAVWVMKIQKSRRAKAIALVIALLIPTTDAIIGRIYLQHLCDTEGGLKVYRVVEGVEGFMEPGATTDYWVKNYGYQFTEGLIPGGKYNRFSRQGDQIIQEWDVTKPKSKYRVYYQGSRGLYSRAIYRVVDIASEDVLATYTSLAFGGGWAERFLAQFSDAGAGNVAFCRKRLRPIDGHVKAVINSLLPVKGNADVNN